ncbi:MAG: hypothetical protein QXT36_03100 [Candidatus Micrarchaeaceae archaeon]
MRVISVLTEATNTSVVIMVEYNKEFLDYMRSKYKITIEGATHGTEREIITFAVA